MTVSTQVYDSAGDLATAVAQTLIEAISAAQAGGSVPAICLTGGTIADRVHHELGRLGPDSAVDWSAVEFWWGDERYVEASSADRNDLAAIAAFLGPLEVPLGNIHRMPSTGSACSVEEGARAYASELQRSGRRFLVTMLGVGPDGHVASLFPGKPGVEITDVPAIPVVGSPKPPPQRVSLTLPTLNDAAAVWLLVSGSEKASAVAEAIAGGDLPAARVHGNESTVWFLDRDAAAGLTTD